MPHLHHDKRLALESSATYRIHVRGCLDGALSDRLSGMQITTHSPKDQNPVTTLEGRVRDQAELIGILSNLYGMHFPILSVELIAIE